jgi:hydrogenase maturation protein HypF
MIKGESARRINVRGIVQGVGFRPFVYALAAKFNLTGWVRNTSAGVEIEVNGSQQNIDNFLTEIQKNPPFLAKVDKIDHFNVVTNNYTKFEILDSRASDGQFNPVSPDASICPDCLAELFDPANRRHRYPFINCTNCGPRFSIITGIPYDRPNTTMARFTMCPACQAEYDNPLDRRFHAQPIACPDCGPQVWFEIGNEIKGQGEDAIQMTREALASGKIIAMKGLGGFHLACDAHQGAIVRKLRQRKKRNEKPFAVMVFDRSVAGRYCDLSPFEITHLISKERPILLVKRIKDEDIAPAVAPGLNSLGLMLPYTPLHYLLLEPAGQFTDMLVMTSGNRSEEPIAFSNDQARAQLGGLADAFLFHDREIHTRLDDSVIQVNRERFYSIRRSRGFAPDPLLVSQKLPQVLATGAELKNTFCLTREYYAFVSHHIGDLENAETNDAFETGIRQYEQLFHIQPEAIGCDLHPDYLSTRYAESRARQDEIPLVRVQHHHAHLAACLAENQWNKNEPVIGVCFDGTGYGTDGAIWGGEFLVGNYRGFERKAHLKYIPLPGGDQAIRFPFRTALAHLWSAGLEWEKELPPVQQLDAGDLGILRKQLENKINCPLTSSMGRLFDATASLVGLQQSANYEAQAAIELEAVLDENETGVYPWEIKEGIFDPSPVLRSLLLDFHQHIPVPVISARFHNSIVRLVITICQQIRTDIGSGTVALSGGVWQNRYLLQQVEKELTTNGFNVLLHSCIPTNDGGISLGQAMVTAQEIINT